METPHIIEDAHLLALIAEAEKNVEEELKGRDPEWPSCAALAYAEMAETCRRFLRLPHNP